MLFFVFFGVFFFIPTAMLVLVARGTLEHIVKRVNSTQLCTYIVLFEIQNRKFSVKEFRSIIN